MNNTIADYKCTLDTRGVKRYYLSGKPIKKADIPKRILPSIEAGCPQKGQAIVSERVSAFNVIGGKKPAARKKKAAAKKASPKKASPNRGKTSPNREKKASPNPMSTEDRLLREIQELRLENQDLRRQLEELSS